MKVPMLKYQRITLRPLKVADAPFFRDWLLDRETIRYLTTQVTPSLKEEIKWIKDQIKSKDNYVWSILREDKKLIGDVYARFDKRNSLASFGIIIGDKDSWGKGYAYEVFEMVIDFCFNSLDCNRVELTVAADNERAKKLYKKLGFIPEGVQRKKSYNLVTKKFEDEEIHSILRQEYKKQIYG